MKTQNSKIPIIAKIACLGCVLLIVFSLTWKYSPNFRETVSRLALRLNESSFKDDLTQLALNITPGRSEPKSENAPLAGSSSVAPAGNTESSALSAATSESASARSLRAKSASENLNLDIKSYLKKFAKDSQFTVTYNPQGALSELATDLDLSSQNVGIDEFAQQVAKIISGSSIELRKQDQADGQTSFTQVHQYLQSVAGIPVYGSYLKVLTRKSDGHAYFISNETKAINRIEQQINFSLQEAKKHLLRRYYEDSPGSSNANVVSEKKDPIIWVSQDGQGVYCWEVVLEISGPKSDRRYFLVSAADLRIHVDRSLRTY